MEMIISMTAAGLGISAIGMAWKAYRKSLECRNLLEYTEKQIQDLDDEVSKNRETVGSALNRLNDNSRRVAWVEAKVRKPQVNSEEVIDDTILSAPVVAPRSSIVERRHRILSLAARGQSSETIASTLGMMPGEVELIINLNRPAANFN
jgi:hypothetical protein